MSEFTISPLAVDDLDGIWLYFAQFDPDNADRFISEMLATFAMLARNPSAGRLRSEIKSDLRSFPKVPYCIFYYPAAVGIRVMRILHSARDIETILESDLPN